MFQSWHDVLVLETKWTSDKWASNNSYWGYENATNINLVENEVDNKIVVGSVVSNGLLWVARLLQS